MSSSHSAGPVQHPNSDASNNAPSGGAIQPPNFMLPPQTEAVSGSFPPPQANSLQFKAGGLGVALSNYRGTLPLPDFIGRSSLFVAAHRVGYAGSGLLGNATRALAGLGQLVDPYAPADTTSTVLRTVKALGNTAGYAIDFSRVDDKRAAARNYLCAPRQQGGYLLTGAAGSHDAVELRALRIRPRDAATHTGAPVRDEAGTQTGADTQATGAQGQVEQAVSATQTPPRTYQHRVSQAGVALHERGMQTQADTRESATQTAVRRSRRAIWTQSRLAATPLYVDRSVQIGGAAAVATGVRSALGQSHRAALAVPQSTAAGTQTAAPDRAATGSQSGREESDAATPAERHTADRATQTGAGGVSNAHQRPSPNGMHVPASIHGNAHWLPIDIVALASSGYNAHRHAGPINVAGVSSDALGFAGDATATFNVNAKRAFIVGAKTLSLLSTTIGLAPSVAQLSSDVSELIRHPERAQAKWNVANSALQLGAGLAAAAASFVFPPAALAPLLFPNLAEIGHALDLLRDEQTLRANGRITEADAVHSRYVNAALDATPLANWFASFYTHGLRPQIERFELAQGNRPDGPPLGELPPAAHSDPRVADFYGQALQERMRVLEAAAQDYLQHVADTAQLDSVTLVSRSPQMFGWPATGQPMRVFDRAVVLTWSRETRTVHGTLFGRDADGKFRLPMLNEGVTSAAGKKNLVVVSDMLDSERKPTCFDLAAFRADTSGSIRIYDPRGYAA